MGLFDKLKRGLQKTKDLLRTDIVALVGSAQLCYDAWVWLAEEEAVVSQLNIISFYLHTQARI